MTDWSDVVARARGLSGRLLGEQMLHSLAQSRDLTACSALLAGAGVIPAPLERAAPMAIELGVRRNAAWSLRLIGRWAGARAPLLAPLFEDEDRRSIRSVLRGAASGSSAEFRLAGLIPTPALPERALMELSRRGDVAAVTAQLVVLDNPYGAALTEEASRQHPDLLRLEAALNRAFAARAHAAGARGDAPMREFVGALLDVENLWTALALADTGGQAPMEEMVAQIWLGQKGYMDGVALDKLAGFADSFVSQLRASKANPLESIRTAKTISPETEAILTATAVDVKKLVN